MTVNNYTYQYIEKSGSWDLNPGPLGPEPSALAKLSYFPGKAGFKKS
jgi:hypothetical protein